MTEPATNSTVRRSPNLIVGNISFFYPRSVGQFVAMDLAKGVVFALAGKDHRAYTILDTTVISAQLGDGRPGWVVGVEYQVRTDLLKGRTFA